MPPIVFPYPFHSQILQNGLTTIIVPVESSGLISYNSIVRTGSRDEVEPGKSGFAHFFEHMMFRGTRRILGPIYDSIIARMGANANAYTTDDYTSYHLTFTTEDLETVVDLESDRFQHLSYTESAFQTEAGAVFGEYQKGITNPFFVLNERMQDLAYDVHTYKHTTIGFEEDIKAMPQAYEYSQWFYNRYYRPENVVLLIIGEVDVPFTFDLIEKYYGSWVRGYIPPAVVPEPVQCGERSIEVSYHGKTLPLLDIAHKGDAFDPANRTYVAAVLLADLAFGETSALYKRLYLRDQRVEMLHARVPRNRDEPLFEVFLMVKKESDVQAVQEEVLAEISRFQLHPVSEERLAASKRHRKYAFLMGLDTPDAIAAALTRYVAISGGLGAVDSFLAALDAVTPGDILGAATKYFVPSRRSVVLLKSVE